MANIPDINDRQRFIEEIDRNFTVQAPAGVGKTQALAERIKCIASQPPETAISMLRSLALVTFTNAAADEMRERSRSTLIREGVSSQVLFAFENAFFGTIHSFCLNLLKRYGHYIGLPADLTPLERDEEVWRQFIERFSVQQVNLPPELIDFCKRSFGFRGVFELARKLPYSTVAPSYPGLPPELDLSAIMGFEAKGRAAKSIEEAKQLASQWRERQSSGSGFNPIPNFSKGGAAFLDVWNETWRPLRDYVRECVHVMAFQVMLAYREFRASTGQLTFDDQISFAVDLMRNPEAAREIRSAGYRVLLDEAQDTDPVQLQLLTEITRPINASGIWLEGAADGPRQGHFTMVGDKQQSIYGSRADLAVYENVHTRLIEDGCAEELVFSVTFRCDSDIVNVVNRLMPHSLDGQAGQVSFIPLQSRSDADSGQVVRIPLEPASLDGGRISEADSIRLEAEALADWISSVSLDDLRARSWSEVAILCPRRRYLTAIQIALQQKGIPSHLASGEEGRAQHPAYAWFSALAWVLSHPTDSFQLIGFLREVFGVSDDAIYRYVQCHGEISLAAVPDEAEGSVADALRKLRSVMQDSLHMTVGHRMAYAVRKCALEERLAALYPDNPEIIEELHGLLLDAAQNSVSYTSLLLYAEYLRESAPYGVWIAAPKHEAIQLYTIQKAKGLGWDCVILPFLHRNIATLPPQTYPMILPIEGEGIAVAIDSDTWETGVRNRFNAAQKREIQRLAYVALTRSRHSLVFVDVPPHGQRGSSFTLCDVFTASANGVELFNSLPATLMPASQNPQEDKADTSLEFGPIDIEEATCEATRFLKRILPSDLVKHTKSESSETRDIVLDAGPRVEAARLYGTWWHEFMRTAPWGQGREAFEAKAKEFLAKCPIPERGIREIELFFNSECFTFFENPRWKIHVEANLFSPIDDTQWMDGVADLIAFDPEKDEAVVLEWKTTAFSNTEEVVESFREQITRYKEALVHAGISTVSTLIYATRSGDLVAVDVAEDSVLRLKVV